MKRTALITLHSLPNYGSVLQAYATARVLERGGFGCDIIDYTYPNEWHYRHGQPRPAWWRPLYSRVAGPLLRGLGITSQHAFSSRLRDFRGDYLKETRAFGSLEALERHDWSGYQAVIAGSDQLWSPRFIKGDKAFMLSFVPDGVRKVSVASSFGVKDIPPGLTEHYRRWLGRFDAITVREENGLRIVRDTLGVDVATSQVLDPTLLLGPDEWDDLALKVMPRVPMEPYIVLYGLYYAFESRPTIFHALAEMQKRLGVKKVVSLSGYPDPECPYPLKVDNRRDVRPEEFVALLKGAAGVVTSSFHGTAFALNFGRPLISVTPADRTDDDRQSSLLRAAGAPEVITPAGTPAGKMVHLYDTAGVSATLGKMRQDNISTILTNIDPSWNRFSSR